MLKLRTTRRSTTTSRRRLTCISPAAVLLLRGVSGSDVVPVDLSNFANEINNERITQQQQVEDDTSGEATLTAAATVSKEDDDAPSHHVRQEERSLVNPQVYYYNINATSTTAALASPTPPPPSKLPTALPTPLPSPLPTHKHLTYIGNDWDPSSGYPLGECEGDCDEDGDCAGELICFQRKTDSYKAVPGCLGGDENNSGTDYCIRPDATIVTAHPTTASPTISPAPTPPISSLKYIGNDWDPSSGYPLGECEGDCDKNRDCAGDLICFQRETTEKVPGCLGGETDSRGTDYCIRSDATIVTARPTTAPPTISPMPTLKPTTARPSPLPTPAPTPVPTPIPTKNPSGLWDYKNVGREKNLGECEGDCDRNRDCVGDLICYQREEGDPLPGCEGTPSSKTDFCIKPEFTYQPTPRPTRRPTPRPTRKPTRTPTASPTFTPIPGGEPVSRIRMYWQWGYTWQEKYTEEKYCLQCRNPGWDPRKGCQVGMKIEIDDCSTSHKQKFVRVNGDKTIRPVMSPDLCISHQNHADDILLDTLSLEYCNGGKQQQFDIVGTPWQKWGKFEIRTSLTSQRQPTCLTNAHHPRRYENIFPQRCDRAREHQTSSWTLY